MFFVGDTMPSRWLPGALGARDLRNLVTALSVQCQGPGKAAARTGGPVDDGMKPEAFERKDWQ